MEDRTKKQEDNTVPEKISADKCLPQEKLDPPCQACGDTGTNTIANGAPCFCQEGRFC